MAASVPSPAHDAVSEPYWNAAREGKLSLQRCTNCGRIRHYPRVMCDACWSFGVEWVTVAGHGEIYSWTVAHHAFSPDVAADIPYVLATVTLAEGVRIIGRLTPGMQARVGQAVVVGFDIDGELPVLTVCVVG
jgi:uncharacterized OB-fold protein